MYNNNQGRTRVNKVVEGKKHKNNHKNKNKNKNKTTHFKRLCNLQNQLFSEGYTQGEYNKYIQEKVNKDMFHYKNISQEDFETLKKRYALLLKKENNKYNEIEDTREMKAKQKKLFKEKKHNLINEKKLELMKEFYKELGKTKTGEAFNRIRNNVKNTFNASYYEDVTQWDSIRKAIFPGVGFIIGEDSKWATIYDKLTERPRSNIVGCANDSDLSRYVFEN